MTHVVYKNRKRVISLAGTMMALCVFATDKRLLEHYINTFHGEVIAILHPYQFAIGEEAAKEILEVYDYEWTDEEI